MTASQSSISHSTVLSALEYAIQRVEKHIEHLARSVPKPADRTIDYMDDIEIADALDDLCSARVLRAKLRSVRVRAQNVAEKSKPEEWQAWAAAFLWDGTLESGKLKHDQQHKYRKDSLRDFFSHKIGLGKGELSSQDSCMRALQRHFPAEWQKEPQPDSEGKTSFQTFASNREAMILEYQKKNLAKVESAIGELKKHAATLSEDCKKRQRIIELCSELERQRDTYQAYLDTLKGQLLSHPQRNHFFNKSREFVNNAMRAIKGANLDEFRDHGLRIVLLNIAIAITGIGLVVLAARSVYASYHPGTNYFFFASTKSEELARKARSSLITLYNVGPAAGSGSEPVSTGSSVPGGTVVHNNPLHRR